MFVIWGFPHFLSLLYHPLDGMSIVFSKKIKKILLSTLEATGILDKVIEINVTDVTDITMNYDNRITVQCGTQLDLERKIRLFRETVMSNSLTENARGTMDLSESGKAIYTP